MESQVFASESLFFIDDMAFTAEHVIDIPFQFAEMQVLSSSRV